MTNGLIAQDIAQEVRQFQIRKMNGSLLSQTVMGVVSLTFLNWCLYDKHSSRFFRFILQFIAAQQMFCPIKPTRLDTLSEFSESVPEMITDNK